MSAALRRPDPANGITKEDASFHLQGNGKGQVHQQPVTLAQEPPDAMIRRRNRPVDDTQEAWAFSPSVASSSPIVSGSHSEHSARPNGQRQPSSTSMNSDTDSSESKNSQDDRMAEVSGYRKVEKKEAQKKKGVPTPLDLRETMGSGLGLLLSPASTHGKLSQIPEETGKRRSSQVDSPAMQGHEKEKILKLSPAQIQELTSSPKSLPLHTTFADSVNSPSLSMAESPSMRDRLARGSLPDMSDEDGGPHSRKRSGSAVVPHSTFKSPTSRVMLQLLPSAKVMSSSSVPPRPGLSSRTVSTPTTMRRKHSVTKQNGTVAGPTPQLRSSRTTPRPLQLDDSKSTLIPSVTADPMPSPMPLSIPMPPLSIPTYLQLELSSDRPSPLYIHRSVTSDFPYESSRVKIERLQNFLLLPPQLEQVLWFGALACLDAWLYSFTILPLRFLKALYILGQSWGRNLALELRFVIGIIFAGTGRMWRRRRVKDSLTLSGAPTAPTEESRSRRPSVSSPASQPPRFPFPLGAENVSASHSHPEPERKHRRMSALKHRRTKSTPSALMPDHKADILKGLLVLFSCSILMYFDASRMYHSIRGQAAIKLYVIYNVLEVCDRLFSALGQDVFECLFSKESLERKPDGRSKVLRPFWLFVLALFYNVVHATALFYQVITLNVAVNSYSNALLTLLMSNQFVEIKSTVFKKFEKENLFQLTCADVVERFQLWLMLMIIASRNIVETGGLSINLGGLSGSLGSAAGQGVNASLPLKGSSILPKSFTIFPKWTGQVMGPFLLVLGSEMLVDWLKHAYITKFNNTKPAIYGRFLDVLAKDYYSNAFADQNLTRRLGLPVIPLSCLFIRASVQTYHMFLATHMPLPIPSTATSLSVESSSTTSPATTAALQHIDHYFRRALGRSSFGAGSVSPNPSTWWSTDDIIAFLTMLVFFLVLFLVLLACKLVLGMCLLSFARRRYRGMKEREKQSVHAEGRRVGGWGVVEVDEDKRRWIYQDDPDGARKLREREAAVREKEGKGDVQFGGVSRYNMVAKRIW